ncbi:hypothetical protein SH2C18_42900 [Clostridium sediminicola]|uniref:alpha/beta hydrolase fold domain-containing protein n=1 Tax=Clostridium sediminicola TaxID=3114879 RepID=UPI0031F274A1
MVRVNFDKFLDSLKTGEFRKKGLECRFIPEKIVIEEEVNVYQGEVNVYSDIFYNEKKTKTNRPVIIFVPGFSEHKTQFYPQAAYFSEKHNVVSIILDLRDFQNRKFPEGIKDGVRLLNWIYLNNKEYSIDLEQIFLVGGYIGGSISSMLAASNGEKIDFIDNEREFPWGINKAVCMGTPFDFTSSVELCERKDQRLVIYFGSEYINNPEIYKIGSSIHYVSKNMANTLILNGDKDELVSIKIAEDMYKEIAKVGSQGDLLVFEGEGHGWFNNSPGIFNVIGTIEEFLIREN